MYVVDTQFSFLDQRGDDQGHVVALHGGVLRDGDVLPQVLLEPLQSRQHSHHSSLNFRDDH